jgi:hypothetical protein
LRRAGAEAGDDAAAYATARDRVLAEKGVTQEQLAEYIRVHTSDLDHLARVWETVNSRLVDARLQ